MPLEGIHRMSSVAHGSIIIVLIAAAISGFAGSASPSPTSDTLSVSEIAVTYANFQQITKGVVHRPRLRVFVDEQDHPAIEMLDEKGASVYSLRR
jgi:hypothetical protein